ncbi:MAG TPA: SMC-Scp complex subunit ScpB [bacterium]|nr:SMC-Scp complex subunit ScpB [bacterium]
MAIELERIRSIVESLIFVSETPISFRKIRTILEGVPTKDLKTVLDELVEEYRTGQRGVIIDLVAEGYQMRTPPENQEWVKMLVQYKPVRLSKAALETLAIIAYRQPVTKTEVEKIRGVDCSSGIAKLMELNLLKILGRQEIPGRPFIYGTTPEFLEVFNLSSLEDLPSLKEIEELDPKDVEAFANDLAQGGDAEVTEEEPEAEADAEPAAEEEEDTYDGTDDVEPGEGEDVEPEDGPEDEILDEDDEEFEEDPEEDILDEDDEEFEEDPDEDIDEEEFDEDLDEEEYEDDEEEILDEEELAEEADDDVEDDEQ